MKILLIFGTRPEAIKMAPLFHKLNEDSSFDISLCVTGQHNTMLYSVLDIFLIKPDYDLEVMSSSNDLLDTTSISISRLKKIISKIKPGLLLVHGDTSTTMAASITGFLSSIPVGHVEAGLRTKNIKSPFPEEFNRRVSSLASDIHFAPTQLSKDNLVNEGIEESSIHITGNTVIDAMIWTLDKIDMDVRAKAKLYSSLNNKLGFDIVSNKFILITAHRRESFGEGFISICVAIKKLAIAYPTINFVYPVHLNPNVQKPVNDNLAGLSNVKLIEPLDYKSFTVVLRESYFILTDSGGIQEEAPGLGKPVLVLRDTTERPEAIQAGVVKLIGTNSEKIIEEVELLIESEEHYKSMSLASNPYGDGHASEKIVNAIKRTYL